MTIWIVNSNEIVTWCKIKITVILVSDYIKIG